MGMASKETASITSLTKQLIAIPSVSGDEAAILQFTKHWFEAEKFHEVIAEPLFTAAVVRASTQPAKRALILCGHIDTVAAGDESAWNQSPWQPYEDNGRLYGLGASDMKAGVALQMIAAKNYLSSPRDDLDVWCVTVANEEVDGTGSIAFARYFREHADYEDVSGIIAEPTDNRIEVGHRGNRFVELLFTGETGHASQEIAYEKSALPLVVNFLQQLATIQNDLHTRYSDDLLGQPTFTPTRISPEGLFSANKTSGATHVAVDIRTTPALDDNFEDWINGLAQQYNFSWRYAAQFAPSALCDADAQILHVTKSSAPDYITISVSPGATDQAFFQEIGVQTVVYGPGDFDQAHTIDESVSIERISEVYAAYQRILRDI